MSSLGVVLSGLIMSLLGSFSFFSFFSFAISTHCHVPEPISTCSRAARRKEAHELDGDFEVSEAVGFRVEAFIRADL